MMRTAAALNPYKRTRSPASNTASNEFDDVCPPDYLLLQVLEKVETKRAWVVTQEETTKPTTYLQCQEAKDEETAQRKARLAKELEEEVEVVQRKAMLTKQLKEVKEREDEAAQRNARLAQVQEETQRRISQLRALQEAAAKKYAALRELEAENARLSMAAAALKKNKEQKVDVFDVSTFSEDDVSDDERTPVGCLTQMVSEERGDQDEEERRVEQHLGIMRKALEEFVIRLLEKKCGRRTSGRFESLHGMIETLKNRGIIPVDLASAMHDVRLSGNKSVHAGHVPPTRLAAEATIARYVELKERFTSQQQSQHP